MDLQTSLEYLENANLNRIYPIFVPSIFRPGHYFYQHVVKRLPVPRNVFYVVRENQYKEYKAAQPDVEFVVIKQKDQFPGYGLDTTRKLIEDTARSYGFQRIIDVDDDINFISFVYTAENTSRRLRKRDRERLIPNIFARMCEESRILFKKYPLLTYGSPCRIFPSTAEYGYSFVRSIVNGMSIPRQLMIQDVERMAKMGIHRDGSYDKHCEDIGFAATNLSKGAWLFRLPCFLYDVPSHEENPRTEAILHKAKPEELWQDGEFNLSRSAIANHIVRFSASSDRGNKPRPVSVNWKTWNKANGTETITEEWE